MSRRKKIAILVACVVAGFVIACVLVAPRVFDLDRYRPYITSVIEQKTGREVSIGRIGLAVFPVVTITVDNFAIANPPGFPAGDWIRVKRIRARPDVGALWHHQLIIRALSLSGPELSLLSDARGRWNYELPPPRPAKTAAALRNTTESAVPQTPDPAAPQPQPGFTLQRIQKLSLKDGRVALGSIPANGGPAAPVVSTESVSCDLKNLNLAAFADPRASSAALDHATGNVTLGSIDAAQLRLTHVTASVDATPQQVHLGNVKFDFYHGRGQADVRLDLASAVLQYTVQGALAGVNAQELLNQFPQARGQLTGTLESHFGFSGVATNSPDPWAGKQGSGTLVVRKGALPKLRIGQSLVELAHLAELGPRSGNFSDFSLISLDWQLKGGVVTTSNVRIDGNGISIDGSGTLDLAAPGQLHYTATAEIAARSNPLSNILAGLSGATFANGKLRLPFTLAGTLDRPLLRLKPGGVLGQAIEPPEKNTAPAPKLLQNLFNALKRKK